MKRSVAEHSEGGWC